MGMMRPLNKLLDVVGRVETEAEAQRVIRQEVAAMLADNGSLMEDIARKRVHHNIGYTAMYLGRERAAKVLALFRLEHPVFGPVETWPDDADSFYLIAKKASEMVPPGLHLVEDA